MANCPSCGFQVGPNWKVCPKCTTELSDLNQFNMAAEQIHQGDKVSASDSVIQGDLFSGNKAETIIINQYGSNPAGKASADSLDAISEKATKNTPTTQVNHKPLKTCSRCKLELTDSLHPLNCIEPSCEKSMCSSCYGLWRVPQMHTWQYCQEHTELHRKEYELHLDNCSSCGTVIGYGIEHVNCEFGECDNTVCVACYRTWHVNDPMSMYRDASGPWNYCESHTQQSINKAKQQLENRIQLLNENLNQNIYAWKKKVQLKNLEISQENLDDKKRALAYVLIFSILIYPGKLIMTNFISGWFFTLYNIFCFWLMIPLGLFFLFDSHDNYTSYKSRFREEKQEYDNQFSFRKFDLFVNQTCLAKFHRYVEGPGMRVERHLWDENKPYNRTRMRTYISTILIDYDSEKEMVITKQEWSDGASWIDEIPTERFGLTMVQFQV